MTQNKSNDNDLPFVVVKRPIILISWFLIIELSKIHIKGGEQVC